MHYELFAIIGIFVCVIILSAEYIWLFVLAERQEESIKTHNTIHEKLESMMNSILSASTYSACEDELEALKKFVLSDDLARDIACTMLLELTRKKDNMIAGKQRNLKMATDVIDPITFYENMLNLRDPYKKSYACRRLADFNDYKIIPELQKYIDAKNRDLNYNAAMALAQLGDREGFSKFILKCQNDQNYSYRIIVEMIYIYTGDMYELIRPLLGECNKYMQSVLIKAIAKYKLVGFADIYLEGIKGNNEQVKIACTKALAALEMPEYMHELIILSKDINWIVRSSAIKGLSAFNEPEAIEAVMHGVSDKDWWVRQISAGALIKMDESLNNIENIVKGYDRYASEAIKYSLYRTYNIQEGEK